MYNIFQIPKLSMPEGFLWGSGYAGHQVEGNNINSSNYHVEIEQDYPEKSGMACNSYEMYKEDIDLIDKLGHQAFRTSIEWSRIEPSEGNFDMDAVEHYISFFSSLKEKGIKTFATLVHFTVPYWFWKKGSFGSMDNLKYFERYVDFIVPKLSPYVDFWNVLNEATGGSDSNLNINNVLYHAAGYHIIKKYSNAPVSSAHAFMMHMPYRPNDPFDVALCNYTDMKRNEYFFHAIRTGEIIQPMMEAVYSSDVKGSADFWSINIYTRNLVDSRKSGAKSKKYNHQKMQMIEKADFYMNEFYPECIIANLNRLKDKPVYITENGCSCDDDRLRIIYLQLHLTALKEAMDMGVDVRGYLHWTLIDNYEWHSYKPKFGLCSVDSNTFERTPKPSAYFYKEVIENNGFDKDIVSKYIKELPIL